MMRPQSAGSRTGDAVRVSLKLIFRLLSWICLNVGQAALVTWSISLKEIAGPAVRHSDLLVSKAVCHKCAHQRGCGIVRDLQYRLARDSCNGNLHGLSDFVVDEATFPMLTRQRK
jgi:hypothetical protein